jgi:membrane associated rhomboid family serine protease
MLLPYRADIRLFRFPYVTVLVSVLCIGVYIAQERSERKGIEHLRAFCTQPLDTGFRQALQGLTGRTDAYGCAQLIRKLELERDAATQIDRDAVRLAGREPVLASHYRDVLHEAWRQYRRNAPNDLTARLMYEPANWSPGRMLSASVAHGGRLHLVGNLFFFFAFAATLEMLLGPFLYIALLAALATGTHVAYSLASLGDPQALPTLGLSGVVMGVMALLTYFVPRAGIRCILWLGVFWKRFSVPAWLFFLVYIGWDFHAQITGTGGGTNLVAHLSGAMIGLLLGITLFRRKRHWARELVER